MNMENALKYGVDIQYGPVTEIPLPPDCTVQLWLTPEIALLRGTKMKTVDKAGVFSLKAGLLADIVWKKAVLTASGLICAADKKGCVLMTCEGRVLAGQECDDAKDLGEGLYAKKIKKLWGIFRVEDGAQITDFSFLDVSEFSEGSCAAAQKTGTLLLGTDGRPLFPNAFGYASPYKNGFAIVGDRKTRSYIDRAGNVVFSGAGPRSRNFQNGYAVFEDPKGRFGAVDTAGRVVIAPQFRFVKDAMSDMFVVSNAGNYQPDGKTFSGRDYGLIRADGREILPQKYGQIDSRPDGGYNYGNPAVWSITSGNRRMTYAVSVSGIVNSAGEVILPDRYVSVGDESEGLRAFKSFEGGVLRFGYMRSDGSTAFEVASVDYSVITDPERSLLREDMALQLSPFRNGEAKAAVRNMEQKAGFFGKKTEIQAGKTAWYRIDAGGREIAAEGARKPLTEEEIASSPELPFAEDLRQMTGSKFLTHPLKDALVQICPFDDMTEVNFTFGFAILDREGHVLCGSSDGMPSAMIAPQYIYTPNGSHGKYGALTKAADNVWIAAGANGTSVLFSEFESPMRFADGLAVFRKLAGGNKYVYGLMDRFGNVAVPPQYSEAAAFENGCFFAKRGEQCMILRREKTVTERQP